MAKVTSKLQLTIPKRIAEQYGIRPGDEIELVPAGEIIRMVPSGRRARPELSLEERLRLFDEAAARQTQRELRMPKPSGPPADRGWTRDELYDRGKPR